MQLQGWQGMWRMAHDQAALTSPNCCPCTCPCSRSPFSTSSSSFLAPARQQGESAGSAAMTAPCAIMLQAAILQHTHRRQPLLLLLFMTPWLHPPDDAIQMCCLADTHTGGRAGSAVTFQQAAIPRQHSLAEEDPCIQRPVHRGSDGQQRPHLLHQHLQARPSLSQPARAPYRVHMPQLTKKWACAIRTCTGCKATAEY